MRNAQTISTLRDLITVNQDAEKGFQSCADRAQEPDTHALLTNCASTSATNAQELGALLRRPGREAGTTNFLLIMSAVLFVCLDWFGLVRAFGGSVAYGPRLAGMIVAVVFAVAAGLWEMARVEGAERRRKTHPTYLGELFLMFVGALFLSLSVAPTDEVLHIAHMMAAWQQIALFNPVVYLISGFRWSFFATADVGVGVSLAAIALFTLACLAIVGWIFRTGYRLRS